MPRKFNHHFLYDNQPAKLGHASFRKMIDKKYFSIKFGLPIIAILVGCILVSPSSMAETIQSAMASAYTGNPTLNAQRAATRVTDEGVPLARSGYLPKLSGSADYGYSHTTYKLLGMRSTTELKPRGFGVTISQTLFDGLKTLNNVRSAKAAVKASQQLYEIQSKMCYLTLQVAIWMF